MNFGQVISTIRTGGDLSEISGLTGDVDVTAIDNLPSLLPVESSEDYGKQLLPSLLTLNNLNEGVWGRAFAEFTRHTATL